MRAAPRRRQKHEVGGEADQPVFLRKAFAMITKCPSDIAGWSPNGDTVLVKDVSRFAEQIIPTAFKHNNFSSFVRQLNFYGFRKIKSELSENEVWWEFHHPRFQRGKQEWLCEIKRSIHYEENPVVQTEVYDLKNEVSNLHERVASLTDQLARLTNLVEAIVANNNATERQVQPFRQQQEKNVSIPTDSVFDFPDSLSKKRKMTRGAIVMSRSESDVD
jgi:hypothetical protein